MSRVPFDAETMKKLVQQDSFLSRSFEALMENANLAEVFVLELMFNTYVLGDSVVERKYLDC